MKTTLRPVLAALTALLLAACGAAAQQGTAPQSSANASITASLAAKATAPTPSPTPAPTLKPTTAPTPASGFAYSATNNGGRVSFIVFSRDATLASLVRNALDANGYAVRDLAVIPKNSYAVCMGPGTVLDATFVADDGSPGTASTNAAQAFCNLAGWK